MRAGGAVFPVTPDFATPLDSDYRLAFDVAQGGDTERMSTSLNTVARYLNMHARAGAASRAFAASELADGVELALSAMTAFVALQREDYLVSPW